LLNNQHGNMAARTPEDVSAWLVDGSIVRLVRIGL
jgi:hypothetical protein